MHLAAACPYEANEVIFSETMWGNLYAWLISACGVTGPWGREIILACYQQNRLQPSVMLLLSKSRTQAPPHLHGKCTFLRITRRLPVKWVEHVKYDTNLSCYLHCHWNLQDACVTVKIILSIFGQGLSKEKAEKGKKKKQQCENRVVYIKQRFL